MKKFQYRLERLKQVRSLELTEAAEHLRKVAGRLQEVTKHIREKEAAVTELNKNLVLSEEKSGTVRPDLRKLTSLYVQAVQTECKKLEQVQHKLQHEHELAHTQLMDKKQSVKILENHEERLSSQHQVTMQIFQQKEDDEMWLMRRKSGTEELL